jgi:hypothetical protein
MYWPQPFGVVAFFFVLSTRTSEHAQMSRTFAVL